MTITKPFLLATLLLLPLCGQIKTSAVTNIGRVDSTTATSTAPVKSGLTSAMPATCLVGDLYFATDATPGANLYACTATNTWTALSGGGTPVAFYTRSIIIPHTNLSADVTNYVLTIFGTYSYLASTGNGGEVDISAHNLVVTSDSACTTPIPFQRAYWNLVSGNVDVKILVPLASSSVDTLVGYICTANASFTTDQQSPAAVWASTYKGVYVLSDGNTLALTDSTSNANTLTNFSSVAATAGAFDGGANFSGSNALYRAGPISTTIANFTIEAWFNITDASSPHVITCNGLETGGPSGKGYGILVNTGTLQGYYPGQHIWNTGVSVSTNTWHHAALVHTGGSGQMYLDGVAAGSVNTDGSFPPTVPTTAFSIGACANSTTLPSFTYGTAGKVDEVRVSELQQPAAYLAAVYMNGITPSTFYTIGSRVSH